MNKIMNKKDIPTLWLVVPCYNEEVLIDSTASILENKLLELISKRIVAGESRILFVDDGSSDNTWELIEKCTISKYIEGMKLSKNEGHQIALIAGYTMAKKYADAIISIDADLQQDVNAIEDFVNQFRNGCDVVYGIRNSRNTDTFFKKSTAEAFYKLMSCLGGGEIKRNSADYRLLSARAVDALLQYEESHVFIRGLIPTIGFKTGEVYFDVKERNLGESKYSTKKMIKFAVDGITSFSIKPIRFITVIGIIFICISVIMLIFYLRAFFGESFVPDISGLILWMFFSGVQLCAMGIIGEYVGRTYMEVKKRPRFFVETDTIAEQTRDK